MYTAAKPIFKSIYVKLIWGCPLSLWQYAISFIYGLHYTKLCVCVCVAFFFSVGSGCTLKSINCAMHSYDYILIPNFNMMSLLNAIPMQQRNDCNWIRYTETCTHSQQAYCIQIINFDVDLRTSNLFTNSSHFVLHHFFSPPRSFFFFLSLSLDLSIYL